MEENFILISSPSIDVLVMPIEIIQAKDDSGLD